MTAKEIKIKQEGRFVAKDYLKKAADNYQQMLSAIDLDNFNAAATLALQCIISSADAICVFEKGIRSVSSDHFDACDLVNSLPLEEAKSKSNLLRKVIAKKNLIQYESRNVYEAEAIEIIKLTTRFYQWVKGRLE